MKQYTTDLDLFLYNFFFSFSFFYSRLDRLDHKNSNKKMTLKDIYCFECVLCACLLYIHIRFVCVCLFL